MAERNYKIAVIGALWTGCLMLDHLANSKPRSGS